MRKLFLLFIPLVCFAQDKLPADFKIGRRLNPAYEYVEVRATLTMPSRWCSNLGCETRLKMQFKDYTQLFLNNQQVDWGNFHDTILPGAPGCVGRQLNNPQKPFYFDDRWPLGMTLRGYGGQKIQFYCRTAAKRN